MTNAGQVVADHFVDANKMIELASGEPNIAQEHIKNNRNVRKLLTDRHIAPEDLPTAEDVKKLERRLKSEEKKLPRQSARLSGKPGSKTAGKQRGSVRSGRIQVKIAASASSNSPILRP